MQLVFPPLWPYLLLATIRAPPLKYMQFSLPLSLFLAFSLPLYLLYFVYADYLSVAQLFSNETRSIFVAIIGLPSRHICALFHTHIHAQQNTIIHHIHTIDCTHWSKSCDAHKSIKSFRWDLKQHIMRIVYAKFMRIEE